VLGSLLMAFYANLPFMVGPGIGGRLRELSAQVADWEPPYRVFKAIEGTCLACNAGPHLTDLGLTDGGLRQIVNPVLEIWPDD